MDILHLKILSEVLNELSLNNHELARSLTRLELGIDESIELSSDPVLEAQFSQAIESRLSSISLFLGGDDNPLNRVQEELESIASLESELSSCMSSSIELITLINELHNTLRTLLYDTISTIPPSLNAKHLARNALSAATIEASLVKLSLMKAQLHQKVYGFTSNTHPDATMNSALSIAYEKLKDEAEDLIEEEQGLDNQIEEYEQLMGMIDFGGTARTKEGSSKSQSERSGRERREGYFAQIVEDYIRVEKETEECKRDLMRLGWTGFD